MNLDSLFEGGFDANSVDPAPDFSPVPGGKYIMEILEAEIKETKAQNGYYLKLKLQVADGPSKGYLIWDNINLANPSEKCVQIGKAAFAALCLSVGEPQLKDEAVLVGKYTVATVTVKEDQNNVRTYVSVKEYNDKLREEGGQPRKIVAPVEVDISPSETQVMPWER